MVRTFDRTMPSPSKISPRITVALLVAGVSALALCANAVWTAPPRFDGAGYALLARALIEGDGYRNVDHPDQPRHAHFPPGYPAVLALIWSATGVSPRAAHIASAAFTVLACLASWCWFRRLLPRRAALVLGLALGANWLWARTGSALQSEPLYLLFSSLSVLAAIRASNHSSRGPLSAVVLGALLAASVLTRYVALGLALAVMLELAVRRRWSQAICATALAALLCVPWLVWLNLAATGGRTQLALLFPGNRSFADRCTAQGLFYLRRIPDAITGPIVEFATVYQSAPRLGVLATVWASLACALIGAGWIRLARQRRRRLAALVPLVTLPMLILWPYTEAGRFLIPLIPFILVGAVEGITSASSSLARSVGWRSKRERIHFFACCVVLAASVPYSVYAAVAARARAQELSQRDFDAACAWLGEHGARQETVLSRHPGEVYWRAGRQGLEVSSEERVGDLDATAEEIALAIKRYNVRHILVDQERYAHAPSGPLARFVAEHPEAVRKVWGRESIAIYEVTYHH
jgi:4-amino-4-deoxy-L-arabinose transferase-like glycosyltransferase